MSFSMSVLNEEEIKAAIEQEVKPVPEEVKKLQEAAEKNVAEIMQIDLESNEGFAKRKEILASIESFGLSMMKTASQKNSLLKITIGDLSKSGSEGGMVAKGLGELQTQLKDLDPSVIDFTKTGFLGKLFNPLRAYFQKYEKADSVIADIMKSLNEGKRILTNDNTTLEIEQQAIRVLTKALRKEIEFGSMIDESLVAQIEAAKNRGEDPEKIRFISEEVLYPLRRRLMDMNEMQAVNQQGVLSYELAIRGNKELISLVEKANTVTITALRTAVTVASVLYNQKIVLQKIDALNKTTSAIIAKTSEMLATQGVEIQQKAMSASISPELLKDSFMKVITAFDDISTYKQQALPKMKETIDQFRQLADVGEKQILRLEKGNQIDL